VEEEPDPEQIRKDMERLEMIKKKRYAGQAEACSVLQSSMRYWSCDFLKPLGMAVAQAEEEQSLTHVSAGC